MSLSLTWCMSQFRWYHFRKKREVFVREKKYKQICWEKKYTAERKQCNNHFDFCRHNFFCFAHDVKHNSLWYKSMHVWIKFNWIDECIHKTEVYVKKTDYKKNINKWKTSTKCVVLLMPSSYASFLARAVSFYTQYKTYTIIEFISIKVNWWLQWIDHILFINIA